MNVVETPPTEEQQSIPFDNPSSGMRLHGCEIYNWGTFHKRVWSLDVAGKNTLLTGDIGSGKSTLVDAITTLLVPAQRVSYNKAAGGEAKERSLRSYVLGHYKSEKGDMGLSAKPVALRSNKDISVILGRFRNQEFNQDVTLAQVFWFKDVNTQPARFFVVADQRLSIVEHFLEFGGDINGLKKRLRKTPRVEIFDTFPPYGSAFRHRFGIDNDQALDLFHQTVSMKSVGNLTDFVRQHMLDGFPIGDRIDALITHFDDLNRAHEAVLKAKTQIEFLAPLVADCTGHAELSAQAEQMKSCRAALGGFFAGIKLDLLSKRLAKIDTELSKLAEKIDSLESKRREQSIERDDIKHAIAKSGGDRIERLKNEISEKQKLKDERQERAEGYHALTARVALPRVHDMDGFLANQTEIRAEIETSDTRYAALQNTLTEKQVSFRKLNDDHGKLTQEIEALKRYRSNIPARMLTVRENLCAALGLTHEQLPFAGELIEVQQEHKDWEGAAERVLHNFALSLLVSDEHYQHVADWVDKTHLKARLVYYRVREVRAMRPSSVHQQSLIRKLSVRHDSPFYDWLETEIAHRFNYICCETFDQFRKEVQALTRNGQIKQRGERHEKDDRHRIDDRTRYVLGWSNQAKISAFELQIRELEQQAAAIGKQITSIDAERNALTERLGIFNQLSAYKRFRDLDWKPLTVEIDTLTKECRALEEGSDLLRTLARQLDQIEAALHTTEADLESKRSNRSQAELRHNQANDMIADCEERGRSVTDEDRNLLFPRLQDMRKKLLGEHKMTVESCDNREREMREKLQSEIDAHEKRATRLRDKIIGAMQSFNQMYPLETRETDAAIEASGEYGDMLARLQSDDLPRFEARFKELLNENTIREVANFQSQLNRERQTIGERIETINQSLKAVDYNPGRFIVLVAEASPDTEIGDFQQSLRACTEGALTGSDDDQYSETKFLQVKSIIERFRGREGSTELDQRWTRKVTDVRNWFTFSASERWREDGTEHEHYSDSGGKSGGQKEKLAYTVLAASLAYQFGLEWGESRARSFRFVVIDEAFGRGSDESAHYGLELFTKLNLQLLIATPLQKIHVIEPYVSSVGFVHNEDSRHSMLRNLTIEEYRAERAAHLR